MSETTKLELLSRAAFQGLVRECGHARQNGPCSCGLIWCEDGESPLLTVTSGDWGDDFASLRFVDGGEGSISPKIEAYIDRIRYGHVPVELAKANTAFLAALWNAYRRGELVERNSQGIEAEGQDPQGLGAKHDSPVAESDAP